MNKYKTVAINGSLDVLTIAHVRFLKFAANLGDRLIVGINSDESIKKLKGPTRPINNQDIRAEFLLSFDFIDEVLIFNETNATEFLRRVNPSIYCVGGRYDLQTMNQDERKYLESINCEIKFFPLIEGYSSSKIIEKMEILPDKNVKVPKYTYLSEGCDPKMCDKLNL